MVKGKKIKSNIDINLPTEIIEKILMKLSLEENLELIGLGYSNFIIKTKLKELSPERKNELWTKYAETGNLKVIKVLHKHIPGFFSFSTISLATTYGHLGVIKYLHSIGATVVAEETIDIAINKEYFNIVKYFFSIDEEEEYLSYMIRQAILYNKLELVKYFYFSGTRFAIDTIVWAARFNKLEIVKFLHSVGDTRDEIKTLAIDWAAEYGHLEVVKYLHSIGAKCTTDAMDKAAYNGHLEVLKYLHSIGAKYTNDAIELATMRGHLKVLKYLHSIK